MAKKKDKPADTPETPPAASPARARVTLAGHGADVVDIPPGAADPHAAAVEAFKAKRGLWALPHQPHVEFDPADEPAPEGGPANRPAAELDAAALDALTVPELKAHAAAKNIDLGGATKKADIVAAIRQAAVPATTPTDADPGSGAGEGGQAETTPDPAAGEGETD